jgi:predicted RNase H-like nuclease (RuvC/YqgF family)
LVCAFHKTIAIAKRAFNNHLEKPMSEISSLYTSRQTVYKKTGKKSTKNKHGDVKHIVYKDGAPLYTEVIKVHRKEEEESNRDNQSRPKRIRAGSTKNRERRSSEEVLDRKRKKLADRLKNAIRNSQTLWSEKDGIWISYQGSQGFIVKQFDQSNRVINQQLMTQAQILKCDIPGLLDTSWEIV